MGCNVYFDTIARKNYEMKKLKSNGKHNSEEENDDDDIDIGRF